MYKSFKKSCLILLSAVLAAMLIAACAFMLSPKTTAYAEEVSGAATVKIGEGDAVAYNSIEEAWAAANNAEVAASITMLADATITDTFAVAAGKNITLDLNGCMLKYNGEWIRPVIDIQGGTFTLEDKSDKTTPHTILSPVTNEEVTINGGLITGGKSGGVYVDNNEDYKGIGGTFTMKGGTISGNTSSWSGGGVFVGGGDYELLRSTFMMTGGTISENKAGDNGGGVFVAPQEIAGGESLNLTARSNTVNKSGDEEVGGLFEMTGGTISGNSARMGGGVYVGYNEFRSKFEISGAPKITGNKANGVDDNVYLEDRWDGNDNAIITVTGELEEGAQIGVTLAGGFSGAFTSGYGENNKDAGNNIIAPDTYFVSDKDGYFPDLENGEVILSTGVATVTVDGVETAYGSIEDAWAYANGDSVTTAATVKMYADATITAALTVAEGNDITLDLNGHLLKNTEGGSVIAVNGTFTLEDSGDSSAQHTIINPVTNEEVTINGGVITGSANSYNGCVPVYGGTFTMNGGTISGNTGTNGGGVNVDAGGAFTMNGGAISGNTGRNGGAVYVFDGTFTMTGGTISGNSASEIGGGVETYYNTTFKMTGGTISGNNAAWNGGGVYSSGEFEVSGSPNITGNTTVIDGNTVENNVSLNKNKIITVTGKLTEGAKIGVNNTGEVATGYMQADEPSKYFIPDNPGHNGVYVSDKMKGTVDIGTHAFEEDFTVDVPATCTEAGSKSKHCVYCDEKTEITEIPATGHALTHHEAADATKEEDGNTEYWSCDNCGKYFSDEAGATEISDKSSVTLPNLASEGEKAYWWLFLLLIPLAIGGGGVMLGIWVYKKGK